MSNCLVCTSTYQFPSVVYHVLWWQTTLNFGRSTQKLNIANSKTILERQSRARLTPRPYILSLWDPYQLSPLILFTVFFSFLLIRCFLSDFLRKILHQNSICICYVSRLSYTPTPSNKNNNDSVNFWTNLVFQYVLEIFYLEFRYFTFPLTRRGLCKRNVEAEKAWNEWRRIAVLPATGRQHRGCIIGIGITTAAGGDSVGAVTKNGKFDFCYRWSNSEVSATG